MVTSIVHWCFASDVEHKKSQSPMFSSHISLFSKTAVLLWNNDANCSSNAPSYTYSLLDLSTLIGTNDFWPSDIHATTVDKYQQVALLSQFKDSTDFRDGRLNCSDFIGIIRSSNFYTDTLSRIVFSHFSENARIKLSNKSYLKITNDIIAPMHWTMFDVISASTLSSRCRFGSCLPTFLIANCSGVMFSSSSNDLI